MYTAEPFSTRYAARIARIHTLSLALGTPVSRGYLLGCDLRALPVMLDRLEARLARGGRARWWRLGRV